MQGTRVTVVHCFDSRTAEKKADKDHAHEEYFSYRRDAIDVTCARVGGDSNVFQFFLFSPPVFNSSNQLFC